MTVPEKCIIGQISVTPFWRTTIWKLWHAIKLSKQMWSSSENTYSLQPHRCWCADVTLTLKCEGIFHTLLLEPEKFICPTWCIISSFCFFCSFVLLFHLISWLFYHRLDLAIKLFRVHWFTLWFFVSLYRDSQ